MKTEDILNSEKITVLDDSFGLDKSMLTSKKYGVGKAIARNALQHEKEGDSDSTTTYSKVAKGSLNITDSHRQQELTGLSVQQTLENLEKNEKTEERKLKEINFDKEVNEARAKQKIIEKAYQKTIPIFDDSKIGLFIESAFEIPIQDSENNISYHLDDKNNKIYHYKSYGIENIDKLEVGSNNKVNTTGNGINTDVNSALRHADQHNINNEKIYLLRTPKSNSFFSEVIMAGYNKFLEGPLLGYSNTGKQYQKLFEHYGEKGLHIDAYSRSTILVYNELKRLSKDPNNYGKFKNLEVSFYGPAANVKSADKYLAYLQGRDSLPSHEVTESMYLKNNSHHQDFVTKFVGFNDSNIGVNNINKFVKAKNFLDIVLKDDNPHNCYGVRVNDKCRKYYKED